MQYIHLLRYQYSCLLVLYFGILLSKGIQVQAVNVYGERELLTHDNKEELDMFEKLKKLITEVTENENLVNDLSLEADLITDIALDSLQFINLILALEDEYNFEIDFDELDIEEISTVGKLIHYIEEHRNDE